MRENALQRAACRVSCLMSSMPRLSPPLGYNCLSFPHRSERRGERVTGVDDLPLQGSVGRADEQLQPRFVQVVGKVLLFRDQCHIRQRGL